MTQALLPGYRVVDAALPVAEEGLRNDVAAFVGSTARGPVGVPVRVGSRQSYLRTFGGWAPGTLPRAVAAYFANGGEVVWVVRAGRGGARARGTLSLEAVGPAEAGHPGLVVSLEATSPGRWAEGTIVAVTLRAFGQLGRPTADVTLDVPGELPLRRAGLPLDRLADAIAATALVTATVEVVGADGSRAAGPAVRTEQVTLRGGVEPEPDLAALRDGLMAQAEVEEVSLVGVPGLDGRPGEEQHELLRILADTCAEAQDRQGVVTLRLEDAATLAAWSARADNAVSDPARRRAVAAYAGWLRAADLTGRGSDRYPVTDPVGHVCGVVARLDRERGSGWSPANELVADAVDTADPLPASLQALAMELAVNLVRPRVGGGLEIWGARTLDPGGGRHLAHRRLLHRIVRAVRRVVEPLVFDTDDEILRFTVARAVSSVLLEAFRSGALAGETPDEAYRVRCDETTSTPEERDAGRVVCVVEVAPAVPMEFITLRLTLGAEGLLEVVEQ